MMLDKTKRSHVEKTLSMSVPTISTRDWLGASLKRLGVNTSAAAEWWWVVGRMALIAATAVGATLFLRETPGYSLLLSYLAFAVVYSALVAVLLWRSQVDWAFAIGFMFDTGGIVGAWWITAQSSAGSTNTNDMYLGLFAVLGVSIARLGSFLGAIYAALLLLWMTWITLTYSAPESYAVQQLPVRLLFMGITAALMLRLVARLTQERRLAEEASGDLAKTNETLIAEIAARQQSEDRIELQVQQLTALRTIDTAITGSVDRRLTLNVLLNQVTDQLGVDSAAVLLLNSYTQTLEYAAGRGFRADAITHSRLQMGQGQAGIAALERRSVSVPDLSKANDGDLARAHLLAAEEFRAYHAVPLITKGQVRGVLEIYHRSLFDPYPGWLSFLEALADQAAIAVDNAALFDDLQRSNIELSLAYDNTLEGWARALDLRDKETEGHSQRVVEWTIRLAQALGVKEGDLIHVRRGALLHDIGKMGIPDAILLKPGPLTEEEWRIMRKHPVYAYEMLSPIAYLHPALDIPYAHHEKWDGTGYPRGLKGTQIPLAARIFSVVDVWDALRSDRPYRPKWSEEHVRDYLREQAGSHFEPRIVQAFLELTEEPGTFSNGKGKHLLSAVDSITARIIEAP